MTPKASAATDNIFSDLKVVDCSSVIAAPAAAVVILSDFGADVIKIEPPTGDLQRIVYKVPPEPRANDNYPWHLDNRNKRGMVLDLKSPQAGEVLERLVKWADVLIVNYPPPTRKKLKLTYEEVSPWNPRLIYADLTGFGDKGPDAQLPGFDVTTFWARSSLLGLTRDAGAPPTLPIAGSGDQRDVGCPVCRNRHRSLPARAHREGLLRHDVTPRSGTLDQRARDPGRALRRIILPAPRPEESAERNLQRVSGQG